MIERLQQARENIEEGKLLFREKIGNKAVIAKYYHAMMGCLFALFDIRNLRSLTHADVIERFEREYVRTGKADALFLKVLRRAYDLTHECDCDHMPVPTDEEIGAAMDAAEGLICTTEELLRTEVKVNESGPV